MTKHDPTDEAETLPGIPKAGSDLEQFPSVPGLFGVSLGSINVSVQEITAVLVGLTVVVAISPLTDLDRSWMQIQGSQGGITSGPVDVEGDKHNSWWEFTSLSTVLIGRHAAGSTLIHKIAVIEYL